jgi:hypothetical protein
MARKAIWKPPVERPLGPYMECGHCSQMIMCGDLIWHSVRDVCGTCLEKHRDLYPTGWCELAGMVLVGQQIV